MSPSELMWFSQGFALLLLSFLSEDAATVGGAILAQTAMLPWKIAFIFCFFGIWLGDLALYGLARRYGRPLLQQFPLLRVSAQQLERSEAWFAQRGVWALVLSRFVPGARLPTYLTAGLLGLSAWTFAAVTGSLALVWTAVVFSLIQWLGAKGAFWFQLAQDDLRWIGLGLVALIAALYLLRRVAKKWQHWEFWPAWLFYPPVVVNYLWLGLKYRSWTLPTLSNPGMKTGGLLGESKFVTLQDLQQTSPEFVAHSCLIDAVTPAARWHQFQTFQAGGDISFPCVLKPDVAQRGAGFQLIQHEDKARAYLAQVVVPVVLQRYVPGPHEAGVFYYRLPNEASGRIFAITEKVFPHIQGDGQRSVAALIHDDVRASRIADTYRQRLHGCWDDVLAPGETLRLVEAGNHCQGCIFREGMHLWSEALAARIDQISTRLHGFFVGRYDVRYTHEEEFKRGEGFHILELNGASSEATSIYDAHYTLREAYQTLFQQWELVFKIGAMNRAQGLKPDSLLTLAREWVKYQRISAQYPTAD